MQGGRRGRAGGWENQRPLKELWKGLLTKTELSSCSSFVLVWRFEGTQTCCVLPQTGSSSAQDHTQNNFVMQPLLSFNKSKEKFKSLSFAWLVHHTSWINMSLVLLHLQLNVKSLKHFSCDSFCSYEKACHAKLKSLQVLPSPISFKVHLIKGSSSTVSFHYWHVLKTLVTEQTYINSMVYRFVTGSNIADKQPMKQVCTKKHTSSFVFSVLQSQTFIVFATL